MGGELQLNKEDLIRLFNKEQRIEIEFPGVRRETAGSVIRLVSLNGEEGLVSFSELDEETVEAAIRVQTDYFRQLGQRFEWKVYDYDKPADLKERLTAHGFDVGEAEALLVLPLNEDNPLLGLSIPSPVRRITDEAGIDDIMLLEQVVWGESQVGIGERLKRDLREDPEHIFIYAAYDGGKAVSAAWMYLHEGTSFGSLWGGSTLPDYRQQGLYTSLIAAR